RLLQPSHKATAGQASSRTSVSAVRGSCQLSLQNDQCFTDDSAGLLNVFRGVRNGDEVGLKLRRGEINAALQTSVKETGENFQIASLRASEINNRRGGKEQAKHRTKPVKGDVEVCALDCVTR